MVGRSVRLRVWLGFRRDGLDVLPGLYAGEVVLRPAFSSGAAAQPRLYRLLLENDHRIDVSDLVAGAEITVVVGPVSPS